MNAWKQLAGQALIGTQNEAPAKPVTGDANWDGLLAQCVNSDREGSLLGLAAALQLARQGGYKPLKLDGIPVCAEHEERPYCSEAASSLLVRMLDGYEAESISEWLELCQARGQLVRPECVPDLLNWVAGKTASIPHVQAVMGNRAQWLITQNRDWEKLAVSASPVDVHFDIGDSGERLAALKAMRQRDPATARIRLESTWAKESPEDRPALLHVLEINLGMEDEPFLEAALDDKRKEVRRTAAHLLGELPQSRLTLRMIERVTPLLKWQAGGLLRSAKLDVTLPEACTPAMIRDGIEQKSTNPKQGQRAWWFQQMLAAVSPAHWSVLWKTTPTALLNVARKQEEVSSECVQGLTHATIRFSDREWAEALVGMPMEKGWMEFAISPALLKVLSAETRLDFFIKILGQSSVSRSLAIIDYALVFTPWNPLLARTIISTMQKQWPLQQDWAVYTSWLSTLKRVARHIPPFTAQSMLWPQDAMPTLKEHIDAFLNTLEFRQKIHQAFATTSTPS
ncbi:MAG: DUF5691 domain-containing protein [Verrucomicrobiota bacterium]|nr:DUF5691 domain-containing protein [Verrucomicrobiota bacterium]